MTRTRRAFLATGAVLAAGAIGTASAAADRPLQGDFEAAVVALPSGAAHLDQAQRTSVQETGATSVTVTGSATTSLTCDACRGQAVSLQVIYADRASSLVVRNVATAWAADCRGCSGWALSLQVIVAASPGAVRAGNRALAVNAGCLGCHTAAAAVQYVVLGADRRELSPAAIERIVSLRAGLVTAMRSGGSTTLPIQRPSGLRADSGPATERAIASTVTRIEDVLATDLHATSIRPDIKITRR